MNLLVGVESQLRLLLNVICVAANCCEDDTGKFYTWTKYSLTYCNLEILHGSGSTLYNWQEVLKAVSYVDLHQCSRKLQLNHTMFFFVK